MMNTARITLCKELYHLSGWNETDYFYQLVTYSDGSTGYELVNPVLQGPLHAEAYPAYDLGYLLQKLPKSVTKFAGRRFPASPCLFYNGTQWVIFYKDDFTGEPVIHPQFAETPEDAAVQMAIEMFKHGILKSDD